MINKWSGSGTEDISCVFRTDNLEAWLKAIAQIKKKRHLKPDRCRWIQISEKNYPYNKTAIFSYWDGWGKESWKDVNYIIQPDFVFAGFPEGVKYFEENTE